MARPLFHRVKSLFRGLCQHRWAEDLRGLRPRRLRCEPLESRQLLAVITLPSLPLLNFDNAGNNRIEITPTGPHSFDVDVDSGTFVTSVVDLSGTPTQLVINAGTGADELVLHLPADVANFLDGGIIFNGEAGSDTLTVVGAGNTARYTPSATPGDGSLDLDGFSGAIAFTGLEPVNISGMALVTVVSPLLNDNLIVQNVVVAGQDAIQVSDAANSFEAVNLWNNTNVVVDTTLVGGDGNDTITVLSADNAHGNTNLALLTGTGTDAVDVAGGVAIAGNLQIASGTISLNGGLLIGTDLTLDSSTAVTQTQPVSAGGLELLGTGPVVLTLASNDVDTLAANLSGALSFRDADDLAIGTVGGTGGVTASQVSLETGGALTQTQAVVAGGLELLGTGPVVLALASNDVDTLAANLSGALSFRDADDLAIGTVGGSGGVTASQVSLETGGALTQTQAVVAGGLELLGTGPVVLVLLNDIDTLAASITGWLRLRDVDDLTVGSVGATAGVTAVNQWAVVVVGTDLVLAGPVELGSGSFTVVAGGSILDDLDDTTVVAAGLANLTAGGAIGSGAPHGQIDTKVASLLAVAGPGGLFLSDKDGLNLLNPLAGGDIVLGSEGGLLRVGPGFSVRSTGGNVTLQAADTLLLAPGSVVSAAGSVRVDLGTDHDGGVAHLRGTIQVGAGGTAGVVGGQGAELVRIPLTEAVLPAGGLGVDGGAGVDTIRLEGTAAADLFRVDDAAGNICWKQEADPSFQRVVTAYHSVELIHVRAFAGDDRVMFALGAQNAGLRFEGAAGEGPLSNGLQVVGTAGPDDIRVGPGQRFQVVDVAVLQLFGLAGNDFLANNTSIPSILSGGDGGDTIFGGFARDVIFGGRGVDHLFGRDGDDFIFADHDYLLDQTHSLPPVEDGDTSDGGLGLDTLVHLGVDFPFGGSDTVSDRIISDSAFLTMEDWLTGWLQPVSSGNVDDALFQALEKHDTLEEQQTYKGRGAAYFLPGPC